MNDDGTEQRPEPLPNGTTVHFDISQGLAVGEGVIRDALYDEGWLYRLDVLSGENVDAERNADGELYAWDFEVTVKD